MFINCIIKLIFIKDYANDIKMYKHFIINEHYIGLFGIFIITFLYYNLTL